MFKLVVLCAFVVAAAAEPGTLLPIAPIAQFTKVVAPSSLSVSKYDTSVIHPTPLNYAASPLLYTHFIKKRSPQLPLGYYAPSTYIAPTPYIAPNPYVASAPLLSGATTLPLPISPAVHLIKKRSAPLLPTTYYAPQYYSAPSVPVLATSYASTPLISSSPLISQPIAYTHLIKKRSAPLLTNFLAPASYSHQSRFDLQTSHAPLTSIAYTAPIAYNPLAYSHVY